MTYIEKLTAIRQQMKQDGVSAYIIPSADPHISEYLPSHYKCIRFVTGFTGSVSTVVIHTILQVCGPMLVILNKLKNS